MNVLRCEYGHGPYDGDELVDGGCPVCGGAIDEEDAFKIHAEGSLKGSPRKGLETFLDYVSIEGGPPVLIPASAHEPAEVHQSRDFFN